MNFHSFIISKKNIVGRRSMSVSGLMGPEGIPLEERRNDKSIPSDDPFFRTDDPDVDPI